MATITIGLEPIVREGDTQTVAARIEGVADQPYRLWYQVPGSHQVDDAAIAHAFLVSVINHAMAVGRDVVIDAPIPRGLAMNLDNYQRVWSTWRPDTFRRIELRPRALIDDEPFRADRGALLTMSGGVDSLFSAKLLAESRQLAAMVTIRGLDVALPDTKAWNGVLRGVTDVARSLDRPLHVASTNWNEVAQGLPGHMGYLPALFAVAILMSRDHGYLAMPSNYSYDKFTIAHETNPLTDPMLGRPGFPITHHGAWARRIDKVAAIASWPVAVAHLRPCYTTTTEGTACGRCPKCIQTALMFCALGLPAPPALGGNPPSSDAIANCEVKFYTRLGFEDAVAEARRRDASDPWIAAVTRRIEANTPLSQEQMELKELRWRLQYLLGGERSGAMRLVRRLMRTLRGRTGPPQLAPLQLQPVAADVPPFAISARGRRLYVERDDQRGLDLIDRHGEVYPIALRMWRHLVASRPWTHIVDVGANYGEMIIDLDQEVAEKVVAVEPNPYVRTYLKRSLAEAGLPIAILSKAVSDRSGTIEFTADRTWSGKSSVHVLPHEVVDHRLETIPVEATTLRALLGDGGADSSKRVLVKIDVEGHELAVLRGLEGAAAAFADFAALVEIRHLPEDELAEIMRSFAVELFDPHTGDFVSVSGGTPGELSALLETGRFYREDAVLRPLGAAPGRS